MTGSTRIVVVGAGIFGVTASIELRARGASVQLLDPGPLPHPEASSTDISKAVRMDYGADDFYTELAEKSIERWHDWNLRWGEELYHEDGFLLMTCSVMRPGGFESDGYRLLRDRGHSVERIDSDRLRERFPAWNASEYVDGYFNPRGGWAESGRIVVRLIEEARRGGVEVREGARFAGLVEKGSRLTGVDIEDGEALAADFVVIAAGAWTPSLLPELEGLMWTTGQPGRGRLSAHAPEHLPRFGRCPAR
jgi:glycine/D-amino acid oxidase-like deaminating enzyme